VRTTADKSRGNRATATATHGTGTVVAVGTVLAGASTGLDLEGIFYNGGTKIGYVVHIFIAQRKVKKQEKVKKQDKIKEILKEAKMLMTNKYHHAHLHHWLDESAEEGRKERVSEGRYKNTAKI